MTPIAADTVGADKSPHPLSTRVGCSLLLMLSSGCWLALDLEGNQYTRAGGASAGGAGGAAASGGGGSSDPHAGMVFVEHGEADFYIDATEVTNRAYAAWLNQAVPPTPALIDDSRCAWNTSFAPGVLDTCGIEVDALCVAFAETFDEIAATSPDRPIACIDWCDAFAYCELNGKHLCGGPGGARIEFNPDYPGAFVTSISEWFFACGGDGELAYPYGAALEPARCNDDANSLGTLVDVGSMAGCEGSFDGVFDLSGNAEEWVNACYLGDAPEASCARAGGAYYDDQPSCTASRLFERSCQTNGTGFRCCAD